MRRDWPHATPPHEVLGLGPNACEAELRRAYRRLALEWHPDRRPTEREEAERRFALIAAAYAHLKGARRPVGASEDPVRSAATEPPVRRREAMSRPSRRRRPLRERVDPAERRQLAEELSRSAWRRRALEALARQVGVLSISVGAVANWGVIQPPPTLFSPAIGASALIIGITGFGLAHTLRLARIEAYLMMADRILARTPSRPEEDQDVRAR